MFFELADKEIHWAPSSHILLDLHKNAVHFIFISQSLVMQSFGVLFQVSLNKRLHKQSSHRWFWCQDAHVASLYMTKEIKEQGLY